MNRKDQHIQYALMQNNQNSYNSFDDIVLLHQSLPKYDVSEIDITTTLCGYKLSSPFFINAMTGGSDRAKQLNQKLAIIAEACDLLMFTGSFSTALTNEKLTDSFTVIKNTAPNILLGTNVGLDKNYNDILRTIQIMNPNIIQIHLNHLQELLMPEGDRFFKHWTNNLQKIIKTIKIPIIVKEIGFGMTEETIIQLIQLGVKTVDISGTGGTNFATIENQRRNNQISYLNNWGISTVISLLSTKNLQKDCEIIASGGVRNPLDIVKSLVLGAKAVGIAGSILKMLEEYDVERTITLLKNWQEECKLIMCLLNCQTIQELSTTKIFLKNETWDFYQQYCINL